MAIYLDNAATSFPKPPRVPARMTEYLTKVGATINRSVYGPAQEAGLVTLQLRERLCRLLGCSQRPTHAILTAGCTMSLNLALQGYLRPGDHCLVDAMAHNAVLRPLHKLANHGVSFEKVPCDREGFLNPADLEARIRPETTLVVLTHGSNVSGSVQDAEAVGEICRRRGIAFLLDAAQTAGHLPLSFDKIGCSALAVPGHKGLLGPGGIGGLLLTTEFAQRLEPLLAGGTGSASHLEMQPDFLPDKLEPGTANLPGIYGWEASLEFLEDVGIETIRAHDCHLMEQFLRGLEGAEGVQILGTRVLSRRVGVFSLDFPGQDNSEVGYRLEEEFGILTRCGLHCAPGAHEALGTGQRGAVRLSFGWYTTEADVAAAIQAVRTCAKA